MAIRWLAVLVLGWVCGAVAADDIGGLQQQQERLAQARDALKGRRSQLSAQADALSARIDSLKAVAPGSEELHQSLRLSMSLVQRLVALDQRLDSLAVEQEAAEDRLRLAYDWEIGRLIQQLSRQPDRELLVRLMVYQESRAALGDRLNPNWLRFGQDMSVTPEDGPDQIRQKIELIEEIATRLQSEARDTSRRLGQLEQEGRVRAQVRGFTSRMALFDEQAAEGRLLQPTQARSLLVGGPVTEPGPGSAVPAEGLRAGAAPEGADQAGPAAARSEAAVSRPQGEGERLSPGQYAAGDLYLEGRKLRARQQEIHQMQVVLDARLKLFQQHLQELLEGNR